MNRGAPTGKVAQKVSLLIAGFLFVVVVAIFATLCEEPRNTLALAYWVNGGGTNGTRCGTAATAE